jgi:hypothetical protein
MSGEAWLYLLAVLVNAVNLFLQVFFTIMSVSIRIPRHLSYPANGVYGTDRRITGTLTWNATISTLSIYATASTLTSSPKLPFTLS